ncbi:MAG TPA: CapA family protein [Allosphingosinicella sp.]|nr:CapA family protein [Allosphingosinicella sp.]
MVTPAQWRIGAAATAIGGLGLLLAYSLSTDGPAPAETSAAQPPPPPCIRPIVMAAVGDVLLHGPFQRWAAARPEGFLAAMAPVQDLLQGADVAVANLEGPAAANIAGANGREVAPPPTRYDGRVYDGYPLFNYHPSIIGDLQRLGVDVLQTANNHALDRGSLGVDRTLAAMDAARMPHTGTRLSTARPEGFDWSTSYAVRRDGRSYKFAFISCTFSTNGLPDRRRQVLHCYEQRDELLTQVRALHADRGNAAVIVMPHWGIEYQPRPAAQETALAQDMAEAGATAIIGTHPHVVQPEAMLTTRDGRNVPVVYSLGNFVSYQIGLPRLASAIYLLGFTPTRDGRLAATMTGWIPLRMRTGAVMSVDALDRLSEGEAAPFRRHLLRTFAAARKLPANPAAYWNRSAAPVCAPER